MSKPRFDRSDGGITTNPLTENEKPCAVMQSKYRLAHGDKINEENLRQKRRIFIVDHQSLRGDFVSSFLKPWATENDVVVETTDANLAPFEMQGEAVSQSLQLNCLILLAVWGQSITDVKINSTLNTIVDFLPEARIAVISDVREPHEIQACLKRGIVGFIPTSQQATVFLSALDFMLAGGDYYPSNVLCDAIFDENYATTPHLGESVRRNTAPDPVVAASVDRISAKGARPSECDNAFERSALAITGAGISKPSQMSRLSGMTNRQQEVLNLLCGGEPNKVIARRLGMTESTVKVHVRQIMRKLGANNRTQAAVFAAGALDDLREINICAQPISKRS